jgi:hypothetical protein
MEFVYFAVAFGFISREMSTHPDQSFITSVFCGVLWPVAVGELINAFYVAGIERKKIEQSVKP